MHSRGGKGSGVGEPIDEDGRKEKDRVNYNQSAQGLSNGSEDGDRESFYSEP